MEPKIIVKPYEKDEPLSKARGVTRIHHWAHSSRFAGAALSILKWFAFPMEVFFRKDFGERYLTVVSFFMGFLNLLILDILKWFQNHYWPNLKYMIIEKVTFLHIFRDEAIQVVETPLNWNSIQFSLLYAALGCYELFRTRWLSRIGKPLHSYDEGTSRILGLGKALAWLVNLLSWPVMALFYLVQSSKEREGQRVPKLITDSVAFTATAVEPCLLFYMCSGFHGIEYIWTNVAAIALLIHNNLREIARNDRYLDFRDSKVEAEIMRHVRKTSLEPLPNPKKNSKASAVIKAKEAAKAAIMQPAALEKNIYPDVTTIINELEAQKTWAAQQRMEHQKRVMLSRIIGGVLNSKLVDQDSRDI